MSDTEEQRAQDLAKQRETEQWVKVCTYVGAGFIALLSFVAMEVYQFTGKNEDRIVELEKTMPTRAAERMNTAEQQISALQAQIVEMRNFRDQMVGYMIGKVGEYRNLQQRWPDGP